MWVGLDLFVRVGSLVAAMSWNVEHRTFALRRFFVNNESVTQTQRDFRTHFNIPVRRPVPDRNTILRWFENFNTTGSVMKKKPPGPVNTARTPENIERVRTSAIQSPKRSVRKRAASLGINESTVRRILHKDLHYHPYKIQVCQQLSVGDYEQRRVFCETMLETMVNNENMIFLMSDEAHFHLNGFVNKQNCRYWCNENPQMLHESPLHSPKVTVWCAVGEKGIIGPYFFEENNITVTVNSERYITMLQTFFFPELRRRRWAMRRVWFQQDGATAHTARNSMAVLRDQFPGHLISRYGNLRWPPRSPDLSLCDFFLWGYLKSRVYVNKPRCLEDLKTTIQEEIVRIPRQMLINATRSFRDRLQSCININGQHLSDVIFKT